MRKIGVLGIGKISTILVNKLLEAGYYVMVGGEGLPTESFESNGMIGNIQDAALFGDLLFLCIHKDRVLQVVKTLPAESICSKTIIDITNPLDYSGSIPPYMIPELINSKSLGEELQDTLPSANIVKALNLASSDIMISPEKYNGDSTMFITGNDELAKAEATTVLYRIGWKDIIDLGDISVKKRTANLHVALNVMAENKG